MTDNGIGGSRTSSPTSPELQAITPIVATFRVPTDEMRDPDAPKRLADDR